MSDRRAHCNQRTYLQCCEVNNAIDVGVLCENLVKLIALRDVDIVVLRSSTRNQLNAVDHLRGCIVKVVNNDNLVACFNQSESCERADISSATMQPSAHVCLAASCHYGKWHESAMTALHAKPINVAYPVTKTVPTAILLQRQRAIPDLFGVLLDARKVYVSGGLELMIFKARLVASSCSDSWMWRSRDTWPPKMSSTVATNCATQQGTILVPS